MPTKRKRPEDLAPSHPEASATRRATRQTPVQPPLPPASHPPAPKAASKPVLAPRPVDPKPIAPRETPVPPPVIPVSPRRVRGQPESTSGGRSQLTATDSPQASPGTIKVAAPFQRWDSTETGTGSRRNMGSIGVKEGMRASDLVAPEITYHVPQSYTPGRASSSLVRPHGPTVPPPQFDKGPPPTVTPVLPPKPPTLPVIERPPPRADRNIDKVVLGNLCFRTWYPSYYGKEVLGDVSGNARGGGGVSEASHQDTSKAPAKKDRDQQTLLERLYVCPSCFKYAKELVAWWGHVRLCERKRHVPGRQIYVHPRGERKVLVPQEGKGSGAKKRRGESGIRYVEEVVQDEGEWSIWVVDGEFEGLFCQNLSLFAKLFLDNKSVFFDVTGFNYYLLVYTPPSKPWAGPEAPEPPIPQVTGFFSKEKMSWDNNNLACILVFPPWQRKGLGSLLMGASYEISRREGILGGPEKPISDLGKKGYKRFWAGEIARWLLSLDVSKGGQETIVDVNDCSRETWIAPDDCLGVLRDMNVVEEAGIGPGKPAKKEVEEAAKGDGAHEGQQEAEVEEKKPIKLVPRVRVDKEAVRQYVAKHRVNLEKTCDVNGFVEGYATNQDAGEEGEGVEYEEMS